MLRATHPRLVLALAAIALLFANGRWQLPAAAWLAPFFLVLFIDSHAPRQGLPIALLVQTLAYVVNWWELIPLPGIWYYVAAGAYGIFYFIPFVIHRLLAPHIPGFAATLVLPSAWVGTEFILQRFVVPYGSWASLAYTQVEQPWLIQFASLTGLAGISFVILWAAAVGAWSWQHRATPVLTRNGQIAFAVLMLVLFGWGQYRTTRNLEPDRTVRVAGLTPSGALTRALGAELERLRQASSDESVSLQGVEEAGKAINDDLMRRTRSEAEAGAEIIVWSEHAARVMPAMEVDLLAQAGDLARRWKVVLVLGVGQWDPDATPSFQNKAVVIGSDGSVAAHYGKARPIVGRESSLIEAGGTGIAILPTEFGRLGTVICHDLDFPDFIREAGREEIAILIGPSADWEAVAPLHAQMARMRAVENGCSLIRPCADGVSLAVDPFGRKLASVHDESETGTALVTMLPRYRLPTFYSRAGNFVAYASLAGLALLLFFGLVGRRGARRVASNALLLLALLAAAPMTGAAAGFLQSFEIKDQFDVAHTEVEFADTAVIVFGSDRKGSVFGGRWVNEIKSSLVQSKRTDPVRIVEVADLRGVPFFIRGMVKRKFPKGRNQHVLLDWKGWFARTYGFEKDTCTIVLFDAAGQIVFRESVREIVPETLAELMERIESLTWGPE